MLEFERPEIDAKLGVYLYIRALRLIQRFHAITPNMALYTVCKYMDIYVVYIIICIKPNVNFA